MPTPRERPWAFGFLRVMRPVQPGLLPLLTAAEMRAWDRVAMERFGIPERQLMENAGRAAAAVVARLFPEGPVVAAIGRGKNGGDAVVLLRTLRAWGREVVAAPIAGAEMVAELLGGWDLPVAPDLADACARAGVVVDAILGTGARGAPRDEAAAAVRAINGARRPVVALDGPTGVDLSDGSIAGDAVRASVTIAFGALKRGLVLQPGRSRAGRVLAVEVGFPPLPEDGAGAALVTRGWAVPRLPRVKPDAHKGAVGQVTVVAGSAGMAGASILAAMGALRSGAGLVRIVAGDPVRSAFHAAVPEAVVVDRSAPSVADALERGDAAVIGPGLGLSDDARDMLQRVLASGRPAVIDADALTLIAEEPNTLAGHRTGTLLLTPHPGEMARLLQTQVPDVTRDPVAAARAAAARFECAVLLKGAPSMVASPDGSILVNATGHSGVATGGMGDTLAGVAGALLAAGKPPLEAGALALFFAGRAAELAGRGRALLPRDVAEALPLALAEQATSEPADGVLADLSIAR
jgi:hydroxyethylthiazole kinase-like uncharacterized protein yjeF